MGYAENLIKWYNTTLALVTERINETKNRSLTKEQVGIVIANHYKFTDNTELYDLVCEKGINLYEEVEHLF